MRVPFGTLKEILARGVVHESITFVPAVVALAGNGFSTEFRLCDHVGVAAPAVLDRPMREKYDAAWVRARLPQVFGYTPEFADVEKSLLYDGFVAVPYGSEVGYPFICSDYYGRTGLMFSPEGPELAMRAKIADAFWSLLLKAPDDLADFETSVYDPGAGGWMHFGCENGAPSYEWTREDAEE